MTHLLWDPMVIKLGRHFSSFRCVHVLQVCWGCALQPAGSCWVAGLLDYLLLAVFLIICCYRVTMQSNALSACGTLFLLSIIDSDGHFYKHFHKPQICNLRKLDLVCCLHLKKMVLHLRSNNPWVPQMQTIYRLSWYRFKALGELRTTKLLLCLSNNFFNKNSCVT